MVAMMLAEAAVIDCTRSQATIMVYACALQLRPDQARPGRACGDGSWADVANADSGPQAG